MLEQRRLTLSLWSVLWTKPVAAAGVFDPKNEIDFVVEHSSHLVYERRSDGSLAAPAVSGHPEDEK
ncbi:MAG: hypothetical protein WD036_10020 [Bauldia sp.]